MTVYLVRIIAASLEALRKLADFDLDLKTRAARQLSADEFVVPGILTEEQIEQVRAAGYRVEILEDLSQVAAERTQEVSRFNRFEQARGLEEFEARTVMGYMTTEEVDSALVNLQTVHSDLVTLITLPHLTWEGRTCRAVRLRAGTRANRIGILFTGSIHAREWGGSDICISFLVKLITAYRANTSASFGAKSFTAAQVRTVLENLDIFVFPNVNPDGKTYSQTFDPGNPQNTWWRKNRNPNTAVSPANPGVDLNRNFSFLWSSGIGTSASASSPVYKGTAAFSEPEARNVQHLFDAFPQIGYYIDIHSFGELVLYNWGDDNNQTFNGQQNFQNPAFDGQRGTPNDAAYREFIPALDLDTAINLGNRMNQALNSVRGKSYTVQQSVGLYPTSATTDDYAFSRHFLNPARRKVYGYTIEFGTQFVPPFAEMQHIINDVSAALTEFCWAANTDLHVRDNISDSGLVPSGAPFWNSPDIWVRNADDNGTTHQNTIRGRNNFIYVRVRNRGLAEARNIKARVFITNFAGTEFIHPQDWIPRNPAGGGSLSGAGTYLIGETAVPLLSPGDSQIVRVVWPASLIPPSAGWHPCLLVEVSPSDGLSGRQVWESGNLAQKNITIINARRGSTIEYAFSVGSRNGARRPVTLEVQRVRLAANANLYLDLKDANLLAELQPLIRSAQTAGVSLDEFSEKFGELVAHAISGDLKVTMEQSTVIALPVSGSDLPGALLPAVRLPAGMEIRFSDELPPSAKNGFARNGNLRPSMNGFTPVVLGLKKLLALNNVQRGKINFQLASAESKPMAVRLTIPREAAVGDSYEIHIVQYDRQQRAVGGVMLQINIIP